MNIYLPENNFGIKAGYYSANDIVVLLRQNAEKPDVILFIADMLEE